MPTTVFLVRHCQSIANAERRYNCDINRDKGLSRLGHMQADYLERYFGKKRLAAVYSSPFKRALDTARAIAHPYKLEPQAMREFGELDCGQWNGLGELEIVANYPNEWKNWQYDPQRNPIPGGETLLGVQTRALPALEKLIHKHPDQNIAVVTHYCVLNVLLCSLVSSLGNFRCYDSGNATVAEIVMDNVPRLKFYGQALPDKL